MNKRLFIWVILLAVLAFSCRTKKEVEKLDLKATEKTVVTEASSTQATTQAYQSVDVDQVFVDFETITILSQPDSLGNQYPMQIIDRHSKLVTNIRSDQVVKEVLSNESQNTTNTEKEMQLSSKTKESTKTKTPLWLGVAGIVFFLVLVFFIIKMLKKWKLL